MRVCPACGAVFEASDWHCPSCGHSPPGDAGFTRLLASPEGGGSDSEPMFEVTAFAELAARESACFWFQNSNELITWALGHYQPGAESFLEVGCGTGFVLTGLRKAYPRMSLCGGEIYAPGLAFARSRLVGAELCQLDARDLPFDSEFDAVGAFDSLEHIPEDELALSEMHRALRPGGKLLLTVPQHPWLWSDPDDYCHHQRRYRRRELVEKVRRAGFEVERVTSFVSLLLPALILSRFLERRRKREFDPMAEFKLPRAIDRAMRSVLAVETMLIRIGISFPAGSSLLLVARRS